MVINKVKIFLGNLNIIFTKNINFYSMLSITCINDLLRKVVYQMLVNKYVLPFMIILLLIPLFWANIQVGYIITLLVTILTAYSRKVGIYFLLVYFPTRSFLIEVNPGLKYIGDTIILALFIITIFDLAKSGQWNDSIRKFTFTIPFLLFCLTGTIAAFLSDVSLIAIIFQNRAYLITFLLLYIVANMKLNNKDILKFLWITLFMGVLLSLHGIVEFISLRTVLVPEAWSNWNLSSVNEMRVYGLTANPNVLGTYLLVCFFLSLYLMKIYKKNYILLIICTGLLLGTLLLTYSRGSILAFGFAFIVYLLWTRHWKILTPVILSILVGLIIIYLPANYGRDIVSTSQHEAKTQLHTEIGKVNNEEQVQEDKNNKSNNAFMNRFKESFSNETIQKSAEWGRLYIVFKGLEIFLDHPLIGTGFATYGDSATLSYPSPINDEYGLPNEMYSDNQYIQILVQTGVIGTLSILIFIIWIAIMLIRKREIPVSRAFFSLLLAALVMSLLYNSLEDKTFTLYFYILLGFFVNNKEKISDE
jgi:O-antigen ligase